MPALTQINPLNAVVVGSGGIARALIEQLLQWRGIGRIYNLQRRNTPISSNSKLKTLPMDALDPATVSQAGEQVAEDCKRLHLLINTVGVLHDGQMQPEKRLAKIDSAHLQRAFSINAILAPLLAQSFSPLLKHAEPAVFASLSARVGSISDNQMGGWYSYRASKAAHNMLLKTLANEWRLSHRNVSVLALHPGTVRTQLSSPFISSGYKNRVLEPEESATALLQVIERVEPGDSGLFLDWQAKPIDW